jgi:hypothetical protein
VESSRSPVDDPNNVSDWLWDLIGRTDANSEPLRDLLHTLPDDKVRRFALEFRFAASLLHHERFIRHVDQGNLSEDNIDDLGYWVVSHGEDYFLEVWHHPETLVGYLAARQADPTSFEFIAESVLEERLGEWPEDILDHWELFCDSSYTRVSDYWEAQQEHKDVPAQ